jgi:hypothetical protein
MTMSLTEYDEKVGRHLHAIEHHADMCERAAQKLVYQPEFRSLALEALLSTEACLDVALTKVRNALRLYREAPPHA